MEMAIRRHAPDAIFRAYSQRGDGSKIDIEEDANLAGSVRGGISKAWRGFLLCAIVDQATGLPIIWTLLRNREYPGVALLTMLAELHELWPDLDAEWIAGDGLYDDDDLARICAQNYGISPLFRHNRRNSAGLGSASRCSGRRTSRMPCSRSKRPRARRKFERPHDSRQRSPGVAGASELALAVTLRRCTARGSVARMPSWSPCPGWHGR